MSDTKKKRAQNPLRPLVEGLERRVLYSADAAALGLDVSLAGVDDEDAFAVQTQLLEEIGSEAKLEASDGSGEAFHLVVLDAGLEDVDLLREAAEQGGAEVLLFHAEDESAGDVLNRISTIAEERGEDIDTISIVSHGSGGQFQLGSESVTEAAAESLIEQWRDVGSHLSDGANLYLYGCNVVDGSGAGQALIDTLADATGADVFASTDLSGAGGDWDLEAASTGDEAEAADGLATPIDASVADAMSSALVDYNEANWSGTQLYNDGAISFTLSYTKGGTIDWHYDGATDTLTVTDLNGGGPNSEFTITDHNGGLNIDQVSIENFRGTLISDADIGTLDLGLGNPALVSIDGGNGSIGIVNLTGPVDGSVTIQADVGTIDITGGVIESGNTIHVDGDLGDLQLDGDLVTGASVEVTGDLSVFVVTGTLDGILDVGGDMTSLDVGGDVNGTVDVGGDLDVLVISGTANGPLDIDGDMTSLDVGGDLNGPVNVGGDLPTLTVAGGGTSTVVVGGDLDTADWSGDFTGTLTVTQTVGHIDVIDDGVNEYACDFTPPTLVFYDGSTNTGSPCDSGNNAPTADPISFTMLEDGTAVVTLTGSDPDAGDAIETYRVETLPANGTLYLGATAITGPTDITAAQIAGNQLTFRPDPDWNGVTSFEYTAHDGDDVSAATATVSITVDAVNDAPTADPISFTMLEDGTAVVTLTGSDPDAGDAIETYRVETLPANGTLYLGATAITGPTDITAAQIAGNQLTFRPDPDWNGVTSFEYTAHDGDDVSAATATVSITVDAVNDAPTADPISFTMLEDGTAVVTLTGSDPDAGDAIETYRVETLPANGTLYLGATAITGPTDITAAQIAGNQLTFRPDPDWNGATSFEYTAHDGDDVSAATATVSIAVTPQPDLPPDIGTDPEPDPEPEDEPDVAPESEPDSDSGDGGEVAGGPGGGDTDDPTPLPDRPPLATPPTMGDGSHSPLPETNFTDGDADADGEESSQDRIVVPDMSGRDEHSPPSTREGGPLYAARRLELDVPAVGYVEGEVSRQVLEQIEKDELRVSGFEAASVALSATVVALMSRSASLIAMAVSAIPAWHRFDPLAVVAMSESSRRAWAQQQKDAEKDEDEDDERLREMLGD
jgi:hypothetical protein